MVMGYYAYWHFPVAITTTIITDLQKERTTDIEIPKATSLSFYLQLDKPPKFSLNPKDIYIILTNKQDNSKTFIYGNDYHNETRIIYFSSSNKTLSSSIKLHIAIIYLPENIALQLSIISQPHLVLL